MNKKLLQNTEAVTKWYLGIQTIFKNIQVCNNWSRKEAWDRLKIELINADCEGDFIPYDIEWLRGLPLYRKKSSIEAAIRVSKKYSDSIPLLDSLAKLL